MLDHTLDLLALHTPDRYARRQLVDGKERPCSVESWQRRAGHDLADEEQFVNVKRTRRHVTVPLPIVHRCELGTPT